MGLRFLLRLTCVTALAAIACSDSLESAPPRSDAGSDAATGSGGTAGSAGTGASAGSGGSGAQGGTGGDAGSSAGGSGGSSGSGGSGGLKACSVLSDEFELPGEPDPALWIPYLNNGKAFQQDGKLFVEASIYAIPTSPYVRSKPMVDLRECMLEVEVASVVAKSDAQRTQFAVDWLGPAPWLGFVVQNGQLYPKGGSPLQFSLEEHRRWRIRSSGGTTQVETAGSDGIWTVRGTSITPAEFAQAGMRLGVETEEALGTTPVAASFQYARAY